jgi:cytochrome b561
MGIQTACYAQGLVVWMLEVVRKGSRILNPTSPSGPEKPPAEGAVTFSTNLSGWVCSMLCSLLFGGYFQ